VILGANSKARLLLRYLGENLDYIGAELKVLGLIFLHNREFPTELDQNVLNLVQHVSNLKSTQMKKVSSSNL